MEKSFHSTMVSCHESIHVCGRNLETNLDPASLPSNFIVWVVSPEADFLKGKNVWANWDVDELKAEASKIKSSPALTNGLLGLFDTGFTNLTSPA